MTPPANPFTQTNGKYPSCMEMLQLIIDGEATDEQQAYFKAHMDTCMPCFKTYNMDMTIKELLKTRCCHSPMPAGLIDQIKMQIEQNSAS